MNLVKSLFVALSFGLPALAAASVNINSADATQIANELKGVGPAKAEAIVSYRNAHGAFVSVDDLKHVKGINQKTLDRNRDAIVLSDEVKTTTPAPAGRSRKSPR